MLAACGLIIDMMRGVVNMQLFYFPENFFLGSFPYFFFLCGALRVSLFCSTGLKLVEVRR